MTKPNAPIFVAWVLHLAAWFLPVLKANDFHRVVPGWNAFRYAACGVWPCEGIEFQTLNHAVLATISVLTTLFFIFSSSWLVLRGSRSLRRPFAWVAAASCAFNTHWILLVPDAFSALAVGYFLWLSSFLFLSLGLFLSRDEERKEAPITVAHTRGAA